MLNYLSKFQIDVLIDNCKTIKKELKKQKGTKDLIEIQDECIKRLKMNYHSIILANERRIKVENIKNKF